MKKVVPETFYQTLFAIDKEIKIEEEIESKKRTDKKGYKPISKKAIKERYLSDLMPMICDFIEGEGLLTYSSVGSLRTLHKKGCIVISLGGGQWKEKDNQKSIWIEHS
jgi:hypothetical protein